MFQSEFQIQKYLYGHFGFFKLTPYNIYLYVYAYKVVFYGKKNTYINVLCFYFSLSSVANYTSQWPLINWGEWVYGRFDALYCKEIKKLLCINQVQYFANRGSKSSTLFIYVPIVASGKYWVCHATNFINYFINYVLKV